VTPVLFFFSHFTCLLPPPEVSPPCTPFLNCVSPALSNPYFFITPTTSVPFLWFLCGTQKTVFFLPLSSLVAPAPHFFPIFFSFLPPATFFFGVSLFFCVRFPPPLYPPPLPPGPPTRDSGALAFLFLSPRFWGGALPQLCIVSVLGPPSFLQCTGIFFSLPPTTVWFFLFFFLFWGVLQGRPSTPCTFFLYAGFCFSSLTTHPSHLGPHLPFFNPRLPVLIVLSTLWRYLDPSSFFSHVETLVSFGLCPPPPSPPQFFASGFLLQFAMVTPFWYSLSLDIVFDGFQVRGLPPFA